MGEIVTFFVLVASLFFVFLFLICFLAAFPLWAFLDCVSYPNRSKALKFVGALFIALLWPFSPLIYAVLFSRGFVLRFSAVLCTVLVFASGTLLLARWDEVKTLFPQASQLASNLTEKISVRQGAGDLTPWLNRFDGTIEKTVKMMGNLKGLYGEAFSEKAAEEVELEKEVVPQRISEADLIEEDEEEALFLKDAEVVRSRYPDGELRSEHGFRSGLLDGPSRTYYKSGNIMYLRLYQAGNLMSIRKYAEDGTLEFDTDYQS